MEPKEVCAVAVAAAAAAHLVMAADEHYTQTGVSIMTHFEKLDAAPAAPHEACSIAGVAAAITVKTGCRRWHIAAAVHVSE